MLRHNRARMLAVATAVLVACVAGAFAQLRNDGTRQPTPPPKVEKAGAPERGQAAFVRLNCSACHSVAGVGNPGLPLDGVGGRLTREQLREWTTGTGAAAKKLSPGVVKRKSPALQDSDLEALLDYLQRQR